MSDSIGNKLKNARLGAEQSVSDVAHVTRITETQIVGLESDDYSVFPSLAYARSFLGLYSNHLGVDASEEIAAMGRPGLSDFRGAPLAPKMEMVPQDSIIPIIKGLPESRPQQVKSILVPLMVLAILLLLPTTFLLGKRMGQAGAGLSPQLPSQSGTVGVPGSSGPVSSPADPVKQRKASDGSLPSAPLQLPLPNPELDALLGGASTTAAVQP